MTELLLPLGIAVGVALASSVPRLRLWWLRRGHERREFCEVCGARPRRIRVLSTGFDDDHALGIEGQTSMSATYCRRHAPLLARRKPNPRR